MCTGIGRGPLLAEDKDGVTTIIRTGDNVHDLGQLVQTCYAIHVTWTGGAWVWVCWP